ncbi:hypothetical protein [Candidatus Phytoplasma sp. AldY-WA1]|uniref:hypothetical protein n=1 Tax=Candidatus Phytoplasma sp. AldY-WA1 TaxID=2852100 RepID=UPI00255071C1|nr:hypothetical protein [Candidatus Phytoplasma sp. AldY-WA1]
MKVIGGVHGSTMTGVAIGTAVCPGIGTVAGGIVGAGLGVFSHWNKIKSLF